MSPELDFDPQGRRLRAALAAVLVKADAPELRLVHDWLDTWSGLGLIVVGMAWQGWDLQLTAYAARDWRANFRRRPRCRHQHHRHQPATRRRHHRSYRSRLRRRTGPRRAGILMRHGRRSV
jgi:hypothetical protein